MSIAVIGGGIRQRPGVRKAQPHSPCCKTELLTRDSKASCPVGAILSHLTACDQSWMRARPPTSMNLLQRDQTDKIEPEH
jgi:hypothetical protein